MLHASITIVSVEGKLHMETNKFWNINVVQLNRKEQNSVS